MSAIETVGRVGIKEALPALGALTIFLFARGLMELLDRFCRALFGTAEGLVGWIPYAGRLAKQPIHKIEQKLSNFIGGAERGIDAHIAASFHKLAAFVRSIPSLLVDEAGLLFGLAAALVVLPSVALVKYLIRVATAPIHAAERELEKVFGHWRSVVRGLSHLVKNTMWGRLVALGLIVANIIARELPRLGARERALEKEFAALRKWVRHRKVALTTGAFIGAFVWALGRLGIGYVRCANVKKVGRALCRMPSSRIDTLLGLLAGVLVLANIRVIAEYGAEVTEEFARDLSRLIGVGEFPKDRFTIE